MNQIELHKIITAHINIMETEIKLLKDTIRMAENAETLNISTDIRIIEDNVTTLRSHIDKYENKNSNGK